MGFAIERLPGARQAGAQRKWATNPTARDGVGGSTGRWYNGGITNGTSGKPIPSCGIVRNATFAP